MSAVDYFSTTNKNWLVVQDPFVTKENRTEVIKETLKKATLELLRGVAIVTLLALAGVIVVIAALLFSHLASFVFGLLALPLGLIPPLATALTKITTGQALATASGAVAGSVLSKQYGNAIYRRTMKHFKYSIHLFKEAKRILNLDIQPQTTWKQKIWDILSQKSA